MIPDVLDSGLRSIVVAEHLNDADLTRAHLNDADLTGADLSSTKLDGARHSSGTKWPAGFSVPAQRTTE